MNWFGGFDRAAELGNLYGLVEAFFCTSSIDGGIDLLVPILEDLSDWVTFMASWKLFPKVIFIQGCMKSAIELVQKRKVIIFLSGSCSKLLHAFLEVPHYLAHLHLRHMLVLHDRNRNKDNSFIYI